MLCSAAVSMCLQAPSYAESLLDAGRNFHRDTSSLSGLMVVVGQSRKLALKGCPAAVELLVRSYNAYIYRESSKNDKSYLSLVGKASQCELP